MSVILDPVEPRRVKRSGPVPSPDPAIGSVFGRLTVISAFRSEGVHKIARLRCVCGTEKEFRKCGLLSGSTKSCGCLKVELNKKLSTTHGRTKDPAYAIWASMKQRCQDSSSKWYGSYGGRGIFVSESWQSFEGFFADMGTRPFKGATLERVNNDGPYSKENCIWADRKTQSNNTRRSVLWEYKGKLYRLEELVKLSGLKKVTLEARLHAYKWSVERAVETPTLLPGGWSSKAREALSAVVPHKLYPTAQTINQGKQVEISAQSV